MSSRYIYSLLHFQSVNAGYLVTNRSLLPGHVGQASLTIRDCSLFTCGGGKEGGNRDPPFLEVCLFFVGEGGIETASLELAQMCKPPLAT